MYVYNDVCAYVVTLNVAVTFVMQLRSSFFKTSLRTASQRLEKLRRQLQTKENKHVHMYISYENGLAFDCVTQTCTIQNFRAFYMNNENSVV
jgi:hypothetical protein